MLDATFHESPAVFCLSEQSIVYHCSFLISILQTDDTIGVHFTAWTYNGVTSHSFNVQASFYALVTGLKLPYKRVFVFGQEVALYAHTNHVDSGFGSTIV